MLVYLDGGPYDGQVWDTSALLGQPQMAPQIEYYDWTPGIKESTRTGKVAAVWQFNAARAQGRAE